MKNIFLYFALSIFLFSCGNHQAGYSEMGDLEMDTEAMPVTRSAGLEAPPNPMEAIGQIDKKIIKDARIGIEVSDFSAFRMVLDSNVIKVNAYISNDDLEKNEQNIYSNITIRIPAESFEPFISFLEHGSEKLMYKNITARDVTEEFIDVETRINTKKDVEKRYIQLLSKAQNVKEILEIEEKLGQIREEIESKEGRLKYLKSQVAFSTIYLHVVQEFDFKYSPVKEKSFIQRFVKSLDKGWKGFIAFILFVFRIWPVVIIGVVIFYYFGKIRKKKLSK